MTSQYGMMDAIRSAAVEMEQRTAERERIAARAETFREQENKGIGFFRMIVDVFGWLSPERMAAPGHQLRDRA